MDANAGWNGIALGVMRENEGNMADFSNDRISLVGGALPKIAGMYVDVSDNGLAGLAAVSPKRAEKTAIDSYYACREGIRVNVVIEDELLDSAGVFAFRAEQERTAFAVAECPPPKLRDTKLPDLRIADELRGGAKEATYDCCY